MDLEFTDELRDFQREVRAVIEERLPADIRAKVERFLALGKDDYHRWQDILAERGWLVYSWPVEHGGTGWSPVQGYIFEEEMGRARAPRIIPLRAEDGRPGDLHLRQRRAEGEVPAAHRCEPDVVVPGLLGAGRRFRPREPAHPRGPRRRPLRRQRDQDLDHRRTLGGHDVLPRAHRYRGQAAGRDLLPPHRHARSGGRGPAHRHHGRRPGDQHRLPHGREGAGREPHRRGEPGWTYAKFLLGHERFGIARLSESKARLAYLSEIARNHHVGGTLLADDTDFVRSVAETEIELTALEFTELRALMNAEQGKAPGVEANMLKIRGTEVQQKISGMLMKAMGYYALPYVPEAMEYGWNEAPIGPEHRIGAGAGVLQHAQDDDLRRDQRDPAQHHRQDGAGGMSRIPLPFPEEPARGPHGAAP